MVDGARLLYHPVCLCDSRRVLAIHVQLMANSCIVQDGDGPHSNRQSHYHRVLALSRVISIRPDEGHYY